MNFRELLNDGKIEKIEREELNLDLTNKDIETAKHNFESEDYNWALSIAYNAVLRAGRGLMAHLGYRPIGKEHHKNVFEFLKKAGFNIELVEYFDNIRKKRNKFVYGVFDNISKKNAEEVIMKSEDFVRKIRTFVRKIRTGEENE